MKYKIYVMLLGLLLLNFQPHRNENRYRWKIKTLTDKVGLSLMNKNSVAYTISDMIALPRPAKKLLGKNRSVVEQIKVVTNCLLIGMGKQKDGDYHLIITNSTKLDTMIAEIPNPDDSSLIYHNELQLWYRLARSFINSKVYYPKKKITFLRQPIALSITGFLFFDKKEHGKGHAKNGIEIHPVLEIH